MGKGLWELPVKFNYFKFDTWAAYLFILIGIKLPILSGQFTQNSQNFWA